MICASDRHLGVISLQGTGYISWCPKSETILLFQLISRIFYAHLCTLKCLFSRTFFLNKIISSCPWPSFAWLFPFFGVCACVLCVCWWGSFIVWLLPITFLHMLMRFIGFAVRSRKCRSSCGSWDLGFACKWWLVTCNVNLWWLCSQLNHSLTCVSG